MFLLKIHTRSPIVLTKKTLAFAVCHYLGRKMTKSEKMVGTNLNDQEVTQTRIDPKSRA